MVLQQKDDGLEYDIYSGNERVYGGGSGSGILPNYDSPSQYVSSSPFGDVKIYDLDAEIPPIERVQIVPNVQNLAPAIPSNTPAIQQTSDMAIPTAISASNSATTPVSTIAPISTLKKPNYLLYGLGALVLALVAYKVLKKKK